MTRSELEHLIRASGAIADVDEVIIIGSQAILGTFPDAPEILLRSMEADLYPRLALTSEWDTAAAQAVVEAAGGTVVDSNFELLRYNQKDDILNPFFHVIGDSSFNWQSVINAE